MRYERFRAFRCALLGSTVCIAVGLIAASAPAAVAPSWLSPVDISAPSQDFFFQPQIALDADGEAVAVWARWEQASDSSVVEASARPTGGEWAAPIDLSVPGVNAGSPRLAMDSRGDAVAVWRQSDTLGSAQLAESAVRPAGGVWQAPAQISGSAQNTEDEDIAVSAEGEAVAVWNSQGVVQAAVRSFGGEWGAPVDVSTPGGNALDPEVGMDPQGETVVVWEGEGLDGVAQSSVRPVSGSWQAPVTISEQGISSPHVAIDTGGEAFAVWDVNKGSVEGSVLPVGGSWQVPTQLSTPGEIAAYSQVAVDARGDAFAVWYDESGGPSMTGEGYVVQSAERPAGSDWDAPTAISFPTAGQGGRVLWSAPEVAVGANGDAAVVWALSDGSDYIVQSAVRPAGGSWQSSQPLSSFSEDAGYPEIAVDSCGNVAAVWDSSAGGENDVVQAAGYDAACAPLKGSSNPAAGVVRQALGRSAATTLTPANPPVLTHATMTRARFRVARANSIASDRAHNHASSQPSIHFTLSSTAKLTITIMRVAPGARRDAMCVALRPRSRRNRLVDCRQTLFVATLVRPVERAGADSMAFSGHIGRRTLSPGSYETVLVASNAAGLSQPVTLTFEIVR
jgi:hypothetical protein